MFAKQDEMTKTVRLVSADLGLLGLCRQTKTHLILERAVSRSVKRKPSYDGDNVQRSIPKRLSTCVP